MSEGHVYTAQLRFADLDAYGHVNNVRFLGFLEDARMAMLHTEPRRAGRPGLGPVVVARHEISYLAPIELDEGTVTVRTSVRELGRVKFALDYAITGGGRLCATATSVLTAYDIAAKRVRRLEDGERGQLGRYLREHRPDENGAPA
jgi:YbgC/YbaW family acyl-CoA thioester hydrolase